MPNFESGSSANSDTPGPSAAHYYCTPRENSAAGMGERRDGSRGLVSEGAGAGQSDRVQSVGTALLVGRKMNELTVVDKATGTP